MRTYLYDKTIENAWSNNLPSADILIAADNYRNDPEEARWSYEKRSLYDNTFLFAIEILQKWNLFRKLSYLYNYRVIYSNFFKYTYNIIIWLYIHLCSTYLLLFLYCEEKYWNIYVYEWKDCYLNKLHRFLTSKDTIKNVILLLLSWMS